jgi:hypothetical protein
MFTPPPSRGAEAASGNRKPLTILGLDASGFVDFSD